MSEGDSALNQAARIWIAELRAAHDREILEQAIGLTVLCYDLEQRSVSVHGVWDAEAIADAMAYAEAYEKELNEGLEEDQDGWACVVLPISPKGDLRV